MVEKLQIKNKLNISQISKAYRQKRISPVEVVNYLLKQIDSKDNKLNSYITVCPESALQDAKNVEQEILKNSIKSPLHGIPIAIKDLIYTKNIGTTMGSGVFQDFIPSYDATVITKLKKAGAIIIGKTNTHELAYGPTGDVSFFGPTRNPYNLSRMSGGSSSGSGVAVAADMAIGALGTDTGGSVRIPASFCGIVGMKPTKGSISKYGSYPLSYTIDHIGPMTKDIEGNALLLNYLVGKDSKDPHSIRRKKEDFSRKLGDSVKDVTIGIPFNYIYRDTDKEIIKCMDYIVEILKDLGISIKYIELPDMEELIRISGVVAHSEVYTHSKNLALQKDNLLMDQTRERILQGANYKAFEYVEAQQMKYTFLNDFEKLFNNVDCIMKPTVPILPPQIGQRTMERKGQKEFIMSMMTKYTLPYNYLGYPSLSVPIGYSEDNLPLGMQIIGKKLDEVNLYRIGYALEKSIENH